MHAQSHSLLLDRDTHSHKDKGAEERYKLFLERYKLFLPISFNKFSINAHT